MNLGRIPLLLINLLTLDWFHCLPFTGCPSPCSFSIVAIARCPFDFARRVINGIKKSSAQFITWDSSGERLDPSAAYRLSSAVVRVLPNMRGDRYAVGFHRTACYELVPSIPAQSALALPLVLAGG